MREYRKKQASHSLKALIALVAFDIIFTCVVFFIEEIAFIEHTPPTITHKVVIILACFYAVFLIGYFVLACLGNYWFRHKYCDDKRITARLYIFINILVMQLAAKITFALLNYFFIQKPRMEGRPPSTFIYEMNLTVFPIFELLIPCWYILKTNRNCFNDNMETYRKEYQRYSTRKTEHLKLSC